MVSRHSDRRDRTPVPTTRSAGRRRVNQMVDRARTLALLAHRDFEANPITETEIAENAIATPHLQANIIESGHLKSNIILAHHLTTAEAVITDSIQIANATIQSAHIQDLAVTSAKIADLSVGTAKIADLAVGSIKIMDDAVLTRTLADLAVATGKLDDLAVNISKNAEPVWFTAGNSSNGNFSIGSSWGTKTSHSLSVPSWAGIARVFGVTNLTAAHNSSDYVGRAQTRVVIAGQAGMEGECTVDDFLSQSLGASHARLMSAPGSSVSIQSQARDEVGGGMGGTNVTLSSTAGFLR